MAIWTISSVGVTTMSAAEEPEACAARSMRQVPVLWIVHRSPPGWLASQSSGVASLGRAIISAAHILAYRSMSS